MKSLFIIFLLFCCFCCHANKVTATKNGGDGSIIIPSLTNNDTLQIDGNLSPYTYCYYSSKLHITVVPVNSLVVITSGFEIVGSNVHITGIGITGKAYGFLLGGSGSGTPISIHDTASVVEIDHVEIYNVTSFIWCKNEQSCLTWINYPAGLFHIYVHDNYMHNCSLDGLYFGSTDPYGLSRYILCSGDTARPRPTRLGDIRIFHNIIDSVVRQAIQVNNADTLGVFVANNTISHVGTGGLGNQGVAIFIGQGTKNDSIVSNTINMTWQHSIWDYGYGNNVIINNVIDSTGFNFSGENYSENPIVVSGVYNTSKAHFYISGNITSGVSSDPAHNEIWINNQFGNLYSDAINVLCTTGKVYNPYNTNYSGCGSENNNGLSYIQFRYKHNGYNFIRALIAFGGMFEHTTTPQKITDAQTIGVKIIRTNVNFYAWNGTNSPESDTLTAHGLTNYLNVNEIPADGSGYSTIDTAAYAAHLTTLAAHSDPSKVVWVVFNEPGNLGYWGITTPTDMLPYIWCCKIAVRIGHQYGFKVYDGGFMANELVYWTYRQMSNAHDADTTNFLHFCIPINYQFGCMHRTNAAINNQVDNMDYLLTQYAGVAFDGNNVHLYLPFVKSFVDTATNYSTSYTGLNQIFYYLRLHTSLPIISNEFGIIDPAYSAATLFDIRKNGVKMLVYYSDYTQSAISFLFDASNILTSFGATYKTQIQ